METQSDEPDLGKSNGAQVCRLCHLIGHSMASAAVTSGCPSVVYPDYRVAFIFLSICSAVERFPRNILSVMPVCQATRFAVSQLCF